MLDTFTGGVVLLSSAQVVDHTEHMQLSCFMRKQLQPSLMGETAIYKKKKEKKNPPPFETGTNIPNKQHAEIEKQEIKEETNKTHHFRFFRTQRKFWNDFSADKVIECCGLKQRKRIKHRRPH